MIIKWFFSPKAWPYKDHKTTDPLLSWKWIVSVSSQSFTYATCNKVVIDVVVTSNCLMFFGINAAIHVVRDLYGTWLHLPPHHIAQLMLPHYIMKSSYPIPVACLCAQSFTRKRRKHLAIWYEYAIPRWVYVQCRVSAPILPEWIFNGCAKYALNTHAIVFDVSKKHDTILFSYPASAIMLGCSIALVGRLIFFLGFSFN